LKIFRLFETYEFYIDSVEDSKLVRIEIFKSTDAPCTLRVRVWVQSTYNLYPTFINFEKNSHDQVFSSDQLNQEITLSVATSPDWLTGVEIDDEKAFFNEVYLSVCNFLR
jgi:hypothetical protein